MPTYATEAELIAYVQDNDAVVSPSGDYAERVLQRAERDVDGLIGTGAVNTSTGLKLAPASLTAPQRAALSRATCAQAEFRLMVGESDHVGGEEYLPVELRPLRTAGRIGPKVVEELSGHGLLGSGCASPTAA